MGTNCLYYNFELVILRPDSGHLGFGSIWKLEGVFHTSRRGELGLLEVYFLEGVQIGLKLIISLILKVLMGSTAYLLGHTVMAE